MAPQKFERKKGFYFNPDAAKKIDMDVVDKGGIDIDKLDKLNYEKAADGEGYFVYYEGSDQKQLDEIYNRLPFEYLYANEHYEDIKWCQENKDFLQREIKESFDAKFAEYGDDFKFDMDFFNYAFLGEEPSSASINLVSEAEMRGFESKGEKKKSSIAQLHEDVDKILETAAENNKEFGLSDAIHQKSEDLKKESKWADPASCRKAMKLAMADYSHKIMKLDMPLDKKKELFGDLMVAYGRAT